MPRHSMLAGAVVASLAIPAFGQTPPKPGASLPRADFIASMDAEFRAMDANRDGGATRAEVEANQRRKIAAANQRRAAEAFARLDTDRNGQLSPAEHARSFDAGSAKVDVAPVMARLDRNSDGKVTIVEYRLLTLANFDRLDADKDGNVTQVEMRSGGLTPP